MEYTVWFDLTARTLKEKEKTFILNTHCATVTLYMYDEDKGT